MTGGGKARIRHLPSGVPGLDEVLGGGIPEFSFNLIAGEPGCGKTTLAQQFLFANATPERRALYFTILGEPPVKMLRYQQQFSFFDTRVAESSINFLNLGDTVLNDGLEGVLARIVNEVETHAPAIVVVDSFRTALRAGAGHPESVREMQAFVQRLALHLTSWQATTFLVGEYLSRAYEDDPVFTVADGIVWMQQTTERRSSVRTVAVTKLRGQEPLTGPHSMRISTDGVRVFPRALREPAATKRWGPGRLSTGLPGLDRMMGGGVPVASSLIVAGPSGSGKSLLTMHFIAAGSAAGEGAVLVAFEESPEQYLERAAALGFDLAPMIAAGRLEVIRLRPLNLSPDEAIFEIAEAVSRVQAQRVVIDSLPGLELALAAPFRDDMREMVHRLLAAITALGSAVVLTAPRADERASDRMISFVADSIVVLQVERSHEQMRKSLLVKKMRSSSHSHEIEEYEIGEAGIVFSGADGGDRTADS